MGGTTMDGKMMDGKMMVSRRIRDGDGRMTATTGGLVICPTAVWLDVMEQTLRVTASSSARVMPIISALYVKTLALMPLVAGRDATLEVTAMQQVKVVSQAIAVVNQESFHLLLGMSICSVQRVSFGPPFYCIFFTPEYSFC